MKRLAALAFSCLPLTPLPAQEFDAGAYLAGRAAARDQQFAASEEYFERVLQADPGHLVGLDILLVAELAQGDFAEAQRAADLSIAQGQTNQTTNLVRLAGAFVAQDWDGFAADQQAGRLVNPLLNDFALAWAEMGRGHAGAALEQLDKISADEMLRPLVQFHQALIHSLVGNAEAAAAILDAENPDPRRSGHAEAVAHAQILSQTGRNTEAAGLLRARFGAAPTDPEIRDILSALDAGAELPLSELNSPARALHQITMLIFSSLLDEEAFGTALIYGRVAEQLNPDDKTLRLTLAQLFGALGRPDKGARAANALRDDPALGAEAMLAEAALLRDAGQLAAAAEVFTLLSQRRPEDPQIWASLGDARHRLEDFPAAETAYSRAIQTSPADAPALGPLLFARAMTRHAQERRSETEADLRDALALQPDNPGILNYLGYSLLEWGGDLDEALDMIERAVAAEPENGAIVDSLAWAYFQLGRYEEAVAPMQRATELMPTDPILSDHFGDVLWAVGREHEARFQWRRALSFRPEEKERPRIQRKLEIGLDALLAEEGAEPLR